jgi:hypothetical protein
VSASEVLVLCMHVREEGMLLARRTCWTLVVLFTKLDVVILEGGRVVGGACVGASPPPPQGGGRATKNYWSPEETNERNLEQTMNQADIIPGGSAWSLELCDSGCR